MPFRLTINYLKRLIYLFYYLRETDFKQLGVFLQYSKTLTEKSGLRIKADVLKSLFRYNISLKDYFCFRFFEKKDADRKEWAGTGFMYEYQLRMNPRGAREVLENKILFLNRFHSFINREFLTLSEIRTTRLLAEKILSNPSGRVVLKGSHGQIGAEVEVISCNQYSPKSLIRYMETKKYDLAEEYVIQHPALMELSPSGLNTVRVFTQLHKGNVDFLGARLRVSVNSPVDNMAAGNLAAPIDIATGVVNGPGVYSDITKEDKSFHPVTGKAITGFVIPHWNEVVELARRAALHNSENRSVGWDIAITEAGPELIEGNHNWCKLLWQMPVKQGLKKELEKYH
jgi:hypothetical protein